MWCDLCGIIITEQAEIAAIYVPHTKTHAYTHTYTPTFSTLGKVGQCGLVLHDIIQKCTQKQWIKENQHFLRTLKCLLFLKYRLKLTEMQCRGKNIRLHFWSLMQGLKNKTTTSSLVVVFYWFNWLDFLLQSHWVESSNKTRMIKKKRFIFVFAAIITLSCTCRHLILSQKLRTAVPGKLCNIYLNL